MKFRYILFRILIGFTIYSLIDLIIDVPFSTLFSSLAIIGGVVLILVLFIDAKQTESETVSNTGMLLFIYWVMSLISIIAGFSSVYLELVRQSPHHFAGIIDAISAIYFSAGTFATVGFGDIYPISSIAKLLVTIQIGVAIIVLPITVGASVTYKIKKLSKETTPESKKEKQHQFIRIK